MTEHCYGCNPDACDEITRLRTENERMHHLELLMRKHGYIESRWCPHSEKYHETIGNECVDCGSDT